MNASSSEWKQAETLGGHLGYHYGGSVQALNFQKTSN